jgi:hypothetical protein
MALFKMSFACPLRGERYIRGGESEVEGEGALLEGVVACLGAGEREVGEQGVGFGRLGAEVGVGGFGYVLIEDSVIDASGFGIDIGWIGAAGA